MKPEHQYVNEELEHLVKEAWQQYDTFHKRTIQKENGQQENLIVENSMPILFFGNLKAYWRTNNLRVVTVGLNPSKYEFLNKDGKPVQRFQLVSSELAAGSVPAPEKYVKSLSEYFHDASYEWFNSFEAILEGMDASYGGKLGRQENTALHTDFCSPLATVEFHSKLQKDQPQALEELETGGIHLWHDLVRYLQPRVILASIAAPYIEKQLKFLRLREWEVIFDPEERVSKSYNDDVFSVAKKNGKVVVGTDVQVNGNRTLLVFSRAVNRPFGSLKGKQMRIELGRCIRKRLQAQGV